MRWWVELCGENAYENAEIVTANWESENILAASDYVNYITERTKIRLYGAQVGGKQGGTHHFSHEEAPERGSSKRSHRLQEEDHRIRSPRRPKS